jgi:hypothetical protein
MFFAVDSDRLLARLLAFVFLHRLEWQRSNYFIVEKQDPLILAFISLFLID